jgi:AcrR family transcriptional regulator
LGKQPTNTVARSSNTEARRAEITGALLAVIARHGYDKATIQAIAAQAGLAPGLIHYHFKNKQEVLVSLIGALAESAHTRYVAVLGDQDEPFQRLRAYLHLFVVRQRWQKAWVYAILALKNLVNAAVQPVRS